MRPEAAKRRLASVLRERGVLDPADAVDIALDVCETLATLHAQGVVHGDLAPEGILVPWPRAAMMGTAEILGVAPRDDIALSSFFCDAPRGHANREYAAPEQRELTATVETRADIWAVGALLHRMLAGAPPTARRRLSAHDVPSGLAHVIETCLATDPSDRPQNIDDVAGRIASFSSAPPVRYARLAQRARSAVTEPQARAALLVLDRLEQAAVDRELKACRPPTPSSDEGVAFPAPLSSFASAPFAGSVSPSIAPVLLSVPPTAPRVRTTHRGYRHLPLLAYAAALALCTVLGFQFARARSASTAAPETAPETPRPPALTVLPTALAARPETKSSPGVVDPAPETAAPTLVTTPSSLPDVSVPPRRLHATPATAKTSPRAAVEERVTESRRTEDLVFQDSARH